MDFLIKKKSVKFVLIDIEHSLDKIWLFFIIKNSFEKNKIGGMFVNMNRLYSKTIFMLFLLVIGTTFYSQK